MEIKKTMKSFVKLQNSFSTAKSKFILCNQKALSIVTTPFDSDCLTAKREIGNIFL